MTRTRMFIVVACASMLTLGCRSRGVLDSPAEGAATVTGRLVAVKDDRPVDGGVDLAVETDEGKREILRVGSAFIAGPREAVLELHRVVDAAKIGDRLWASGHRESSGALIVEKLRILD